MPICNALILTLHTEAIFILLLERTYTWSQLKKEKAVNFCECSMCSNVTWK